MNSPIGKLLAKKCQEQLRSIIEQENSEEDSKRPTDIFFVASCCDWMPIKMKSKRRLALEKVPMNEPAPANILSFDNQSVSFANFVAPGHHYFYFVEGSERVFLSPNYPIVRFKHSNVFLNRLTVKKRPIMLTKFAQKRGKKDEEIFTLPYSIFNRWEKEEEPGRTPLLKKMFEFDMRYAKLERLLKNDVSNVEAIKKKVWKHYEQLKDIYLFEIGRNGKS
jgi:hypothetical protein